MPPGICIDCLSSTCSMLSACCRPLLRRPALQLVSRGKPCRVAASAMVTWQDIACMVLAPVPGCSAASSSAALPVLCSCMLVRTAPGLYAPARICEPLISAAVAPHINFCMLLATPVQDCLSSARVLYLALPLLTCTAADAPCCTRVAQWHPCRETPLAGHHKRILNAQRQLHPSCAAAIARLLCLLPMPACTDPA